MIYLERIDDITANFSKVKALTHDFGGICDDGFAIEEADVICRQLGN